MKRRRKKHRDDQHLQTYVEARVYDEIQKQAEADDVSVSAWIRRVLEEKVKIQELASGR